MACWQIPVKKLSLSLIILSSLYFTSFCAYPLSITGKVIKVHDGDTVTIEVASGTVYKVRLLGIDAPELEQGEWGYRAKDYLSGLILDKEVNAQTDDKAPEYDKYHRLLAYIWLNKDGLVLINEEMLREGYSYKYKYERLTNEQAFVDAEENAKSHHLGVWSATSLQIPSEYRKEHKHGTNYNHTSN